jgi:HEAT repeat protein
VVDACIDLLAGHEVEGHIVYALGGPPARWAVAGGASGPDYWLRVWALRGLLWIWDDAATSAVVTALADEAWRVREAAARVAGRHALEEALDTLLSVRDDDPVERVRTTASRAIRQAEEASA